MLPFSLSGKLKVKKKLSNTCKKLLSAYLTKQILPHILLSTALNQVPFLSHWAFPLYFATKHTLVPLIQTKYMKDSQSWGKRSQFTLIATG